jgi:hypothetical protein
MLTPAETASRILAGIQRKITLPHNYATVILIEIANGLQADRHQVAQSIAETATALLPPGNATHAAVTPGTPDGTF